MLISRQSMGQTWMFIDNEVNVSIVNKYPYIFLKTIDNIISSDNMINLHSESEENVFCQVNKCKTWLIYGTN